MSISPSIVPVWPEQVGAVPVLPSNAEENTEVPMNERVLFYRDADGNVFTMALSTIADALPFLLISGAEVTGYSSDLPVLDPIDDLANYTLLLNDETSDVVLKKANALTFSERVKAYTPTTSADWDEPVPSNIAEALDQLAARVRALENP